MKILRLLNKFFFLVIITLLGISKAYVDEKPVDIWNIDKKETEDKNPSIETTKDIDDQNELILESDIYKMQTEKKISSISLDENLDSKGIELYGLYDPEDYGLEINMWSNSDGDQLKSIFSKINKMRLSKDASEIVKISMLTNSYPPKKNILEKEFFKFKSDWLIKKSDLELIEEYIVKNQIFD